MLRLCSFSLLAALGGALTTGCSSPQESAPPGVADAPVATGRDPGARADSLGGIPDHKFGQPISAFPGLVLAANQTPGTRTYHYPDGKGEPGWFGKRKQEMPNEFYSFYTFSGGQFVAFQALAYGDGRRALREQALYLFGPGKQWPTGVNWEGKQVLAYYTTPQLPSGPGAELDVQSQEFVRARDKAQQDKLMQENAQ